MKKITLNINLSVNITDIKELLEEDKLKVDEAQNLLKKFSKEDFINNILEDFLDGDNEEEIANNEEEDEEEIEDIVKPSNKIEKVEEENSDNEEDFSEFDNL